MRQLFFFTAKLERGEVKNKTRSRVITESFEQGQNLLPLLSVYILTGRDRKRQRGGEREPVTEGLQREREKKRVIEVETVRRLSYYLKTETNRNVKSRPHNSGPLCTFYLNYLFRSCQQLVMKTGTVIQQCFNDREGIQQLAHCLCKTTR